MTATWILLALATLLTAFHTWRRHRYYLHVFQLEGYKVNEFRAWLSHQPLGSILLKRYAFAAIIIAVLWLVPLISTTGDTILALVAWSLIFSSARMYRSDSVKKPLVFTARMRRLTFVVMILAILFVAAGVVAALSESVVVWFLLGLLAADMLAPRLVTIGGMLTQPIEKRVQEGFKNQARTRLAQQRDTTVIGITGSYGKTSVKFAIAEILRRQFNVLETPASYNTPMGICKVINNDLEDWHRFLVLEMGARYVGDIKELCEIARPDVAVLTSIGLAHLETMGSEEAIVRTKGELVEHMKSGGLVVANGDDDKVMRIVRGHSGPVLVVSTTRTDVDIYASDITYNTDGCSFRVTDSDGGEEELQTLLLGKHNVINILLALAVGRAYGMTLRQMKHGVRALKPVPHRLALRQEGDITVIDDAFNSNPVGARNALEILSQFEQGTRFIVTPGMVELGERQDEENRAFGAAMLGSVDTAVLVGSKQSEPIHQGLIESGFVEANIEVVDSLFEAQRILKRRMKSGDVVLYENDLPDQYDEFT